LDEENPMYAGLAQKNVLAVVGKGRSKAVQPQKNKLLLSSFDWSMIMTRPGGLLSLVLRLYSVPVSVL